MLALRFLVPLAKKIYQEDASFGWQEKRSWLLNDVRSYPWLDAISSSIALVIVGTSFTIYKGLVVGANGYGFDAAFIAWDRLIFAGHDAWVVSHAIFSTPTTTWWLDALYHQVFPPMLIGYFFAITATGRRSLRQTYMLTYLVCLVVVGMLAANILHSAGPVFDGIMFGNGDTFAPLMERLQAQLEAGGGPVWATLAREYLLNMHRAEIVGVGAGISAMPSMHMVFTFLWVFPAWHVSRMLGFAMICYAMIIWIGSVHLGWHYFADGLVALAICAFVWRVVGHFVGLYGQQKVPGLEIHLRA